ncbi:hypothetical protein Pmani_031993 [Petrolisthes manimaculis]|uniref:Uncharacterized protein n=1 Tax=Petrolisthes manimaculis TaxID=1843537 RepID=A0AAE1TU84_9EUCA|nr:hypothetical protein Pmani_031993 [Petrolisthes manimaculis]
MSVPELIVKLRRFTVPDLPRRRNHENIKLRRERSSSLGLTAEVPGVVGKQMSAGDLGRNYQLNQDLCHLKRSLQQIDQIQHDHRLERGHNFDNTQQVDGRQHHPSNRGSVALTVSPYELVTLLRRKAKDTSVESLDSWCHQWRQDNHSFPTLSSRPSDQRRCTIALPLPWEQGGHISSSSSSSASSPTDSSVSFFKSGFRGSTRWNSFRAKSLFSLACLRERVREMLEKDVQVGQSKKNNKCCQRILRPPTRYCYRRGISGLPIQCAPDSIHLL